MESWVLLWAGILLIVLIGIACFWEGRAFEKTIYSQSPLINSCGIYPQVEAVYYADTNKSFYCDGKLYPVILEDHD